MRTQPRVLVIHGPNLNLLGEREPAVYGSTTLAELDASLHILADELGVQLTTQQSNHEGTIVEWIQGSRARGERPQDGLIVNPGGYTHTSVAIADALRAVSIPAIEVHLSNLYARDSLRHTSITGVACAGIIMGLGTASYLLALRFLAGQLGRPRVGPRVGQPLP
ncbi:MAG: type II 3-dehydroquinate dehydratase [Nannocystis sp.]|uniref:type II 3-dehydroquinate dehydratase n=1 Tax=Nannocystis sp. TaxID=1962667 RepID=UPI00242914FF|nr:type II 3-dehydroquinate dehydratase [Nannocystis sp.]